MGDVTPLTCDTMQPIREQRFARVAIFCLVTASGFTDAWMVQSPLFATAKGMMTRDKLHKHCPTSRVPNQTIRMLADGHDEDNEAGWEKWGARPLSHIEPVFRPPAEAESIILQVTNGCSWNQCTFCEMYTSEPKKFKVKPLKLIEEELVLIAELLPYLSSPNPPASIRGPRRIFLADGDAMTLPQKQLSAVLDLIAKYLPGIRRPKVSGLVHGPRNTDITGHEQVEGLSELRKKGLALVYVGCESGDDEVLKIVNKGETLESSAEQVRKVKKAGIKASVMILNGLGCPALSRNHAINSAKLVSMVQPDYLSTLHLTFPLGMERFTSNFPEFRPLTEEESLLEMEYFLDEVDVDKCIFRSDHSSNLLVLKGVLGKDKQRILQQVRSAREGLLPVRSQWEQTRQGRYGL